MNPNESAPWAAAQAMTDPQLQHWCRDVLDDEAWTAEAAIAWQQQLPWYIVDARLHAAWVKGWLAKIHKANGNHLWRLRIADHPETNFPDPGDIEPPGGL